LQWCGSEGDGCHIENPNGMLVSLREDAMTLRGGVPPGSMLDNFGKP
jgi:hypothetical protein